MHYAYCYKNLKFGWDFASTLYDHKDIKFPTFLHGDDLILWRAYKFMQGYDDPVVAEAASWTTKGNEKIADDVQNLLLAKDVRRHHQVSQKLRLPLAVVIAYEKLFFNVLDRKDDHSYIMSIIYPEGRLVEGMDTYLEKTGLNTLIMRAGYNHGSSVAAYLMGADSNHPFGDYDATTGAMEMDGKFMVDGLLYAAAGFLHAKNATPILNARLSIQAGKMGRGDQQDNGAAIPLDESFKDTLVTVSRNKAKAIANNVIEVESPKIELPRS